MTDKETCYRCNGTGKETVGGEYITDCIACSGKGTIPSPVEIEVKE